MRIVRTENSLAGWVAGREDNSVVRGLVQWVVSSALASGELSDSARVHSSGHGSRCGWHRCYSYIVDGLDNSAEAEAAEGVGVLR